MRPDAEMIGQNSKAHDHDQKAEQRCRDAAVIVVGKDDERRMVEKPEEADDAVDLFSSEKRAQLCQKEAAPAELLAQ